MPADILVKSLFSSIAGRYDLANDILSIGWHRIWYRKVARLIEYKPRLKIIDLATGTGNISLAVKRRISDCDIFAVDFSADMLRIAGDRLKRYNLDINLTESDILNLPYKNDSFDYATISWGIRNVESVSKCLSEIARVVKNGGKVIILEFGQPEGFLGQVYKFYGKVILKPIGGLISGNYKAYNYLTRTAGSFPCGDSFLEILKETNQFDNLKYICLSHGIAYIYIATIK